MVIWVGLGGIIRTNFDARLLFYGDETVWAEEKNTDDDLSGKEGGVSDSEIVDSGINTDDSVNGDNNTDINDKIPNIYIKSINPGYTVDGVSNVGEMIEIARRGDLDTPISLAGLVIGYTNSSGNYSVLMEFPEHAWLVGETMILRYKSAPEVKEANLVYTKTLALKASLSVRRDEEVVDEVCWTSKEGCYKEFKSNKPTMLVRNLETGEFEHREISEYEVKYQPENYKVGVLGEDGIVVEDGYGDGAEEAEATVKPSQCRGLVFSEILSYYETAKVEQYIEVYNGGSEQILLDGCMVRYKNKNHEISGIVEAEGYYAIYPSVMGFALTKNPTNSNTLELIDTNGEILDVLIYPNGQRKGTSYAFIGYDENGEEIWKVTYAPTPGAPNNYQEYKTCEEGKVINKATGNCVKIASITTKVCAEGQYLNLLTGRCKKYETASEKTCKEGYYLNPDTGRCRKIIENKGADYSLEPEEYTEESSFVGLYAILGVIGLGLIYLMYEFRGEIAKGWRKIWGKIRRR